LCAPWELHDQDSDLKNDLATLLTARLLERAAFIEVVENLISHETNAFHGRLKKNYARPAIRIG
ncbi:unnamed protein product, partial [Hymenolepis diminuta]